MPITTSYMICTNPRSGSWLLAEGMESTKVAGKPREWFDKVEETKHLKHWKIPEDAPYEYYINKILEEGVTPNGIWGAKCMRYQFEELPGRLPALVDIDNQTIADSLNLIFPHIRYIWLRRRDILRQAISYYRASRSKKWWQIEGAVDTRAPTEPLPEPVYDKAWIARYENLLIEKDAGWQRFFDESAQKPLVIYYEDFAQNYEETIQGALTFLGIENAASAKVSPPRLKKQATAITDEWAARYEAERNGAPPEVAVPSPPPVSVSVIENAQPLTHGWRRWIGENKLFNTPDERIIGTLKSKGVDETAVRRELASIASDPYFQAASFYAQLLYKNQSYSDIRLNLAALSQKNTMIERRSNVSAEEFLEKYYAANRPVILCDIMKNWKALECWTPDYFKKTCGDVVVEIMADRNESDHYEMEVAKHQRKIKFGEFADMIARNEKTNDYYLTARNEFFKHPGVKPLLNDIEIFPEYLDGTSNWMFLWYGPASTVTPLHHDHMNIFMAQVQGRKRIRLVPAGETALVYNNEGVYSPIDLEKPDYEKFPKFRGATIIDIELAPGEVLFIPAGWWHHVRSLETSITVTFMNFKFQNRFDWMHPVLTRPRLDT